LRQISATIRPNPLHMTSRNAPEWDWNGFKKNYVLYLWTMDSCCFHLFWLNHKFIQEIVLLKNSVKYSKKPIIYFKLNLLVRVCQKYKSSIFKYVFLEDFNGGDEHLGMIFNWKIWIKISFAVQISPVGVKTNLIIAWKFFSAEDLPENSVSQKLTFPNCPVPKCRNAVRKNGESPTHHQPWERE
jgi:hypothetical protein